MSVSQPEQAAAVKVRPRDPLYGDVLEFLYDEAELLDEDRLVEWLAHERRTQPRMGRTGSRLDGLRLR